MVRFAAFRKSQPHSAFTLLEMLVAVAIAGILCVLIVTGIGHWEKSSQSVVCTSNMRQVGLAMTQYISEHDLRLPGPLFRGQTPYYETDAEGSPDTAKGNLITFLTAYLDLKTLPPGHSALADIASCPAWLSGPEKIGKIVCFYSTGQYTLPDGSEIAPFGSMGSAETDATPPMSMAALESPSAIPALREFDRRGVSKGAYSWDPRVPETPVHQTVRHVLYFDGHVDAAAVN